MITKTIGCKDASLTATEIRTAVTQMSVLFNKIAEEEPKILEKMTEEHKLDLLLISRVLNAIKFGKKEA